MDKQQLADHGFNLFGHEGMRATVESIAGSPKVAAVVATSTAGMGLAAKLEMLQSAIGMFSLCVGAITGCVVLAIQSIKLIRIYRSWTPNKPDAQE
jgi:hypothetical protein